MVGGGQLARMTQQAAIALAVDLTVLGAAGCPAAQAGAHLIEGSEDDPAALRALAEATDVVTFDHEQVPLAELETLVAQGRFVRPAPAAKRLAQDKLHARRALADLGLPVPAFAPATSRADVERFAGEHGWPVVVKARSGGYDGRGVAVVDGPEAAAAALTAMRDDAVVEEHVAIARELAVLIARRPSGETAVYPVVETRQEDAQLRELVVGAPVPDAERLGVRIVEHADATGIVAVELFETADGSLLVNELALRPHNSGHWTIEGAVTSQFEQHLRAVLDWPLGATDLRAAAVATVNVLGHDGIDPRDALPAALAVPGAHVHLYGKDPRPGRKLGHVTALADDAAVALATAHRAVAALEGRTA